MTQVLIWAILGLLILGLAVFFLAWKFRGKKKHEPDYYTFFIIGVVWTILGFAPGNRMFFILGLAFMALGLVHKDKWKKNRRIFKNMDSKQQKMITIVLIILGALILAGITVSYLKQKGFF